MRYTGAWYCSYPATSTQMSTVQPNENGWMNLCRIFFASAIKNTRTVQNTRKQVRLTADFNKLKLRVQISSKAPIHYPSNTRDGNRPHKVWVLFSLTSRTVWVRSVKQFGFVWLQIWVIVRFGFCSIPISTSVQCSRWLSLGSVWFGYYCIFVRK